MRTVGSDNRKRFASASHNPKRSRKPGPTHDSKENEMVEPSPREVEASITWKEAVEAWRILLQAARDHQREQKLSEEEETQL